MMNSLFNVIVLVTLVLTFVYATELGPGAQTDELRTVTAPVGTAQVARSR